MTETNRANHVVLVPGSWHGGWAWAEAAHDLTNRGYRVTVVDLPSNSGIREAGLYADAAAVRQALDAANEPTVLVGHSYAGLVLSEVAGHPAISHAVYVAAFVPAAGLSCTDLAGGQLPDWMDLDASGAFYTISRDNALRLMAANAPTPEAAEAHVTRLTPAAARAFTEASTTAGWGDTPVSYLLTERDEAVPVAGQEAMAAIVNAEVTRIDTPHIPMLSENDFVVDYIAKASDLRARSVTARPGS